MSTIDTSTWNSDAELNVEIEGIPLNSDAGIAQTWKAIQILMAALKGDMAAIELTINQPDGATIVATNQTLSVVDNSHAHTIANVSGLQAALNALATEDGYLHDEILLVKGIADNGTAIATATQLLVSSLGNAFTFRGSVASVSALPSPGNAAGDVYVIESSGAAYAWNGSSWTQIGEGMVPIADAQIDALFEE